MFHCTYKFFQAALVGYRTKKVLYFGVKNKFCSVCARVKPNETPKKHDCFKNWKSSDGSAGMEASIVVEGFKQSESTYGIRYHKLIADGDSSVYKQILDARPYKHLTVEKVECRNHLLRNLCRKLRDMTTQKHSGKLEHRQLLGKNILRIRKGIVKAVKYRKSNNHSPRSLQNDIINSVNHVFGEHSKCDSYFCSKPKEFNYIEKMKAIDFDFYSNVLKHLRFLARHSTSLLQNVDSNVVESLNGIIAKLIGGKRIHFAKSRSYQGRCAAATVIKNTKRPMYTLYKTLLHRSPAVKCPSTRLEVQRYKKRVRQNELRVNTYRKRIKFTKENNDEKSYGHFSQKPDMSEEDFNNEKERILKYLEEIAANRDEIERETVEQSQSRKWLELRRYLLTASNFGQVILSRPDTGCEGILKSMLYSPDLDTRAMEYGREHEQDAKKDLELALGIEIKECGLYIDSNNVFLGATPDGLIGHDTLVEVKCPFSAAHMDPEEAILNKKITFWKINKKKEITGINTNHKYYYQVQGQLQITGRKYGIIVFWTKKDIRFEKIERDDNLWNTKIFPKLKQFYFNCLLPELVDPRHPRSMPIRNPDYIIKAKQIKMNKK